MEEVLHTLEHFENIFLHLPIKELLIMGPLACMQWQAAIAASPRPQRAIFFTPLRGKPLQYLRRNWINALEEYDDDPHAYTVLVDSFFAYMQASI